MPRTSETMFTFDTASVPKVRIFELMSGWDAAMQPDLLLAERKSPAIAFHFGCSDATHTCPNLTLSQADACLWLTAIDGIMPLRSIIGASVALRFMALIHTLSTCEWAGHLLQEDGTGTLTPHPGLIRAAANCPLTFGSTFAEADLRSSLSQSSHDGLTAAAQIVAYTGVHGMGD